MKLPAEVHTLLSGAELRNGHESPFSLLGRMNSAGLGSVGAICGGLQSRCCSPSLLGLAIPKAVPVPRMVYSLPKEPVAELGCKPPEKA